MADSQGTGDIPGDTGPSVANIADALETLDPAYFGFVMSTGIVSIAFRELGIGAIAWPLAVFNVVCYGLLLVLFGIRVLLYPNGVATDLRDRERHWGTLTFLVATNRASHVVFVDEYQPLAVCVGKVLKDAHGFFTSPGVVAEKRDDEGCRVTTAGVLNALGDSIDVVRIDVDVKREKRVDAGVGTEFCLKTTKR